ncbi:MAG TPA: hypothetical protein VIL86_01215 [Tepidisphaeraceae bacterium]|jgi:hypothetical protein
MTKRLCGIVRMGIVAAAVLSTGGVALATPVVGQKDTFTADVANWTNGGVPDPAYISTNGADGPTDGFMQVSSGTYGGGSRFVVFNQTQWIGNYLAAGVGRIDMDVENLDVNASALTLRIALRSSSGGSTVPGYISTAGAVINPGTGWQHVSFPLTAASMTAVNSPAAFSTFMTSVGDVRILSSAGNPPTTMIGDSISGQGGIDNIQALPEPSVALGALAMLALGARRHK